MAIAITHLGLRNWIRAGAPPPPRHRKRQRFCPTCGTWVNKATKRHKCDRSEGERGRRTRRCASCLKVVRTTVKRHKCDAPPLEIPDDVAWKRCKGCGEDLPCTREVFEHVGAYCKPTCRECVNRKRRVLQ